MRTMEGNHLDVAHPRAHKSIKVVIKSLETQIRHIEVELAAHLKQHHAGVSKLLGEVKGRRCISGRRAALRTALYMTTLAATRFDPVIRVFYQQFLAVGKVKKVDLVACMRKLLTRLNAIVKSGTPWNEKMNVMKVENA